MTGKLGPILLPNGSLLDRGRSRPGPEPTPPGIDPAYWATFRSDLKRLRDEAHVDPRARDLYLRRLALDALDPELAEVVALAEQPLDVDAMEQAFRDPAVEMALAREVEEHLSSLALLRLGTRYVVRADERRVLTADGREIEHGWHAHERLRRRARTTTRLPRRYKVMPAQRVVIASGQIVPGGWEKHVRELSSDNRAGRVSLR